LPGWLRKAYRKIVPTRAETSAVGVTFALAALVGIGAGFVSLVMDLLVGLLNRHAFFGIGTHSAGGVQGAVVVLVPAATFLAVAFVLRRWAPEAQGTGIGRVMSAVSWRGGFIRARVIVAKILGTALCVGAGAPLGLEGPVVHTGAAVGSLAGRRFRMGVSNIRLLAAAGAAGALAAVYGAPIGGAVFSAELLLGGAAASALLPLIIAAFLAVLTRHIVIGAAPEFDIPELEPFGLNDYVLFIVLGVLCGLAAVYFIKSIFAVEDAIQDMLRTWWAKAIGGGLLVGFVGMVVPEVMGTGHGVVQGLLKASPAGAPALLLLVFLVLAKPFLCSVACAAGTSGGVFAPSLLTGGALGVLFARAMLGEGEPTTAYCLVGMAAMVAAVMRAPLQAILIIFELTRDYSSVLPLMIACVVAVKVSEFLEPESVFTRRLVRAGRRIHGGMDFTLISGITVRQVMDKQYVVLPPHASIREIEDRVRQSENRTFPVAGDDGRLDGIVMLANLIAAAVQSEGHPSAPLVADLLEPAPVHLAPDDSLSAAWEKLRNYDYDCLPVCEEIGQGLHIVGICEKEAILERHDREAFVRLQRGHDADAE
jgi:CIC family chloride channel protein